MILPRSTGTEMTTDVRELTSSELEVVSGGDGPLLPVLVLALQKAMDAAAAKEELKENFVTHQYDHSNA
jgi:hypothetical protein